MFGSQGKLWLTLLQDKVTTLAKQWNLTQISTVKNLSYNFVASAMQKNNPVILKISPCGTSLDKETQALTALQGFGCITILASMPDTILLQKATPGLSLKTLFPSQEKESIIITANLIKTLHQASLKTTPTKNFPTLEHLFRKINSTAPIPLSYLTKALEFKEKLLATSPTQVLLHGDLHHENILLHNKSWIAIDPKGYLGDPAYETTAFIRNPSPELLEHQNAKSIMLARIKTFSQELNISEQRILEYSYIQTILSWIWNLEDNLETTYFENLAKMLFPGITQKII